MVTPTTEQFRDFVTTMTLRYYVAGRNAQEALDEQEHDRYREQQITYFFVLTNLIARNLITPDEFGIKAPRTEPGGNWLRITNADLERANNGR